MGTELVRPHIKEEILETQSVPPGFESIASFTLKRVREKDTLTTISDSASVSESETLIKNNDLENDDEIIARSLKRRSWINYTPSDENSGDESDTEQSRSHKSCLPKGVIRGCSECFDCQKVIARWRPEEACRPDLGSVPVFYPSEEEFEDTLNYIASIRAHAEKFGICRIVPPSTWKPPCPLKDKKIWEGANFSTRIQRVDKLQNRDSVKRVSNIDENTNNRRSMDFDNENNSVSWNVGPGVEEGFGFEPGPEFTLDTFQKYANDFKLQYFRKKESVLDIENKNSKMEEQWDPEVEDIEGEYWRMVEAPSAEIEVLYGADLETGIFGSGFPKSCNRGGSVENEKYVNSGWNLNNLPRLSGSVLSYESADISGVLVPWLYIGMCFSSFCWHVEDHHLYSMNYMHWGSPKIWYGVPAENALKLEESMKKHLPELFYEQPDLLHKLAWASHIYYYTGAICKSSPVAFLSTTGDHMSSVTQLSPSILKADGVPVYRCVQNPGEFVLTFPRAYHSGFNCGFNCAEAVNVAPVDWLPYGQNAIELYREQGRKTSISHDKLLLGAARAAVKAQWEINLLRRNTPDNLRWKVVCGKDGLLSKAFKHRVETERGRVQFLWNFSKPIKMEKDFDSTSEKECAVCFFDLHLFAVGCHCSPNRYTCLYHTKQLCSCPWSVKSCLYRYNVDELNVFAEALEGKLSAIHKWAKEDLGLVLSSYISKDKGLIGDSSHSLERPEIGKMCQQPAISSLEDMAGKEGSEGKTKEMSCQHATVIEKPRVASHNMDNCTSQITKVKDESEVKKPSYQIKDNIILLSDDEGEEVSASGSVSVSASNKDSKAPNIVNNETVKCEKDLDMLPDEENNKNSSMVSSNSNTCKHDQGSSNIGGDVITNTEKSKNSGILPGVQNNIDRCIRQKGPRIAKVVRRINSQVEPLDYGAVCSGNSWCNSRAIFPKGFKSRVRYISVLDPTNMCYYISQILDAGKDGPLFMVSLEHCSTEVFIHTSPLKCWDMVRERVNHEIAKQLKLGTKKLPPLQPPGSLDGIEMFGLSTPAILQVIQKMDSDRMCTDYWEHLPMSNYPQSQPEKNTTIPKTEIQNDHNGLESNLSGLLKKANLEELQALRSVLNGGTSPDRTVVSKLLHQEINKRWR